MQTQADTEAVNIMELAGGISQAELARRAGLSRSHLSLILRGQRQPSLVSLQRLADALSVPLSQIIALLPQAERPQQPLPARSAA